MRVTRVVIQFALLALLPLTSAIADERDPIFDTPVGHDCFRDLLRDAAWGLNSPFERAAFIVEQSDGSIACKAWPSMHTYLSESFRGSIPPRTIAIVHTHPVDYRLPSLQDKEQATRLGIPIYVVTIRGVYKAIPGDRRVAAIAEQQSWIREAPRGSVSGSVTASR